MICPKKLREGVIDEFFDGCDFDLDPDTFSKDELLEEFKLLKKGCHYLVDEHVEVVIELNKKTKKPNTSGFLKKIGLQQLENVTLYRLAILRMEKNRKQWPKTIRIYDAEHDEETGKVTTLETYTIGEHPLNAENIAKTHWYGIARPKAPYKEALKDMIHQVIIEQLGRKLTPTEYDEMANSFLDDGNMGQVMRKIVFREKTGSQ